MNQFPLGKYIGKIGEVGELSTESESLLVANDISWDEFSDKVLQGLVPTPWSIPESEYSTRLDLREECIFSIDPPTARDLDDALSCQSLPNGNYRVGYHIIIIVCILQMSPTL